MSVRFAVGGNTGTVGGAIASAKLPERPCDGIGLVLSGGGAKGGYQIGVWRALRRARLDTLITGVAGTSIGAVNAALFALSDVDASERGWRNASEDDFLAPKQGGQNLKIGRAVTTTLLGIEPGKTNRRQEPRDDAQEQGEGTKPYLIGGYVLTNEQAEVIAEELSRSVTATFGMPDRLPSLVGNVAPKIEGRYKRGLIEGLYTSERLRAMLERVIPVPDGTKRPVEAYATVYDLVKQAPVYLRIPNENRDRAIDVALASACMPGIYAPTVIDGMICCDGGLGDNRPVRALYEQGWRRFIVVHLNRASRIETQHEMDRDRNDFPDATIVAVAPGDSFDDSFVNGTLNVSPKLNAANIELGLTETQRQFSVLRLFPELELG